MNASESRRLDPAGLVIAALLLVLAALVLWDMSTLRISSTYGVGPKAMPIVVATGLIALAIGNVIMTFQGDLPAREPYDARAVLLILGGLVGLIAMIALGGGFIVATAILFTATAAAFGRRALFADAAIGLGLGIVVFLLFDKVLTLSLPAGPIERLL